MNKYKESGANLVLGGDIVVAGNKKVLAAVQSGKTAMVTRSGRFRCVAFLFRAFRFLPRARLFYLLIGSHLRTIAGPLLCGVFISLPGLGVPEWP